jgi:DNA-binding SARP family transcriptional activator
MRIEVLGHLEVTHSGEVVRLAGQRQRALLAALVLSIGQIVSVSRLVDVLWGADPPRTARTKLYAHVWALREEIDRVAPGCSALLATSSPGYRLASHGVSVDLAEFKELTARGREALNRRDAQAAAELYRRALELWRGQPFADVSSEAIAAAAEALGERYLQALEASAEADLALGRCDRVAADLGELLISHPHRERMRALCMLALYRLGCRANALSLYHAGREATMAELGLEPGPNLRRLQQQILLDEPALMTPTSSLAPPTRA